MIQALLIDLDGVLRFFDAEREVFAERMGRLPAGSIRNAAFAHDLLEPAITGRTTDARWREQVAERLQALHPSAEARDAITWWSDSPGRIDSAVLEIVRKCRRRMRVAMVTNATTRLAEDLAKLGIDREFDFIFNSSALGLSKPDPRLFQAVLSSLGEPAHAVFFVDDNAGNVSSAQSLGIASHRYRGAAELSAELSRLGVHAHD